MKKIASIIVLTLAINFLAVVGGVGYLAGTGRLDREKTAKIREIVFDPSTQPLELAAAPTTAPATQPVIQLETLLARSAGRTSNEQIEFLQESFDAQIATLEKRRLELAALERQVQLARDEVARDRAALELQKGAFAGQVAAAQRLAQDKGFQDSLQLYNTMPAKQVKAVFMGLDDETVVNYLQSMQPRRASAIIKEFKSPEELSRIARVLEIMRQSETLSMPSEKQTPSPSSPTARTN